VDVLAEGFVVPWASSPEVADSDQSKQRCRYRKCRSGGNQSSSLNQDYCVRRSALWTLLLPVTCVLATEPFGFVPPPFLEGPVISRAAIGNTYSFEGIGTHPQSELQLTRVEIPAALASGDITPCAEAFLIEIKRRAPDIFWQKATVPLLAGEHALDSWRWNGEVAGRLKTGVVSCGIIGARFVAITFEDAIRHAPESFPIIRKSLKALAIE
jgi:hypothetical protein